MLFRSKIMKRKKRSGRKEEESIDIQSDFEECRLSDYFTSIVYPADIALVPQLHSRVEHDSADASETANWNSKLSGNSDSRKTQLKYVPPSTAFTCTGDYYQGNHELCEQKVAYHT